MKTALALFLGIAIGAVATYYLTPWANIHEYNRMAKALRLAEERADRCEGDRR